MPKNKNTVLRECRAINNSDWTEWSIIQGVIARVP